MQYVDTKSCPLLQFGSTQEDIYIFPTCLKSVGCGVKRQNTQRIEGPQSTKRI